MANYGTAGLAPRAPDCLIGNALFLVTPPVTAATGDQIFGKYEFRVHGFELLVLPQSILPIIPIKGSADIRTSPFRVQLYPNGVRRSRVGVCVITAIGSGPSTSMRGKAVIRGLPATATSTKSQVTGLSCLPTSHRSSPGYLTPVTP